MKVRPRTYLLVACAIAVGYVLMCLLGPNQYSSEESIKIRCSNQKVAWTLADFNEWSNWFTEWNQFDSSTINVTGNAMMVEHGVEFNYNGMIQRLEIEAIYGTIENIDIIQIQRYNVNSNELDASIRYELSADEKGNSVVKCVLSHGEIPFIFRGAIWTTRNAHQWKIWNVENLESLRNYLEATPASKN